MGEDSQGKERIKGNMLSTNSPYTPLYGLQKDHKDCLDPQQGPVTRPICGGNIAYNHRLSHLLSMILDPVWNTEEMLAEISRTNEQTLTDVIIGLADVRALYPSLDIEFTIEKVCEEFRESEVKIEGVDYNKVGLYLALNMTPEQIRHL